MEKKLDAIYKKFESDLEELARAECPELDHPSDNRAIKGHLEDCLHEYFVELEDFMARFSIAVEAVYNMSFESEEERE